MPVPCAVWWATARPLDASLLDEPTRARLATMRRAGDRERHATAARLGDLLVRAHGGASARVVRARGERPRVVGAAVPLHLSVAHAGPHVAVAIGPHPLGVDVEPLGADVSGVAAALAPGEAHAVARLPAGERDDALLRIWVRKEALLKAAGTGFAVDARTVDVGLFGTAPAVPVPEVDGSAAILDLRGPDATRSALAVIGGPAGADERDGDALLPGSV